MLTPEDYQRSLERDAAAFVDLIATADLDRPVPCCPGWTMLDLGRHVGSVHRWARETVRTGRPGDEPDGPDAQAELVDWLTEGAALLLDTLRSTDPALPVWTFGPPPRVAAFWSRRQAHETAIHLVDARQALGLPVQLDPTLATDGVDEVATMFFPRQVRLERIRPLRPRHAAGPHLRRELRRCGRRHRPRGRGWRRRRAGPRPTCSCCCGERGGLDRLQVDGDDDVVRAILAAGVTP